VRRLTRRALLASGAGGLFAGWALTSGFHDHVLRMIGESFGPEIAGTDAAESFATDIFGRLEATHPEQLVVERAFYRLRPIAFPRLLPQEKKLADHLVTEFVLATNVLQYLDGQDERLVYLGLFDPWREPCRNTLGAAWSV
jgi:hypothetical protein